MTDRELMQMALDALMTCQEDWIFDGEDERPVDTYDEKMVSAAFKALRARLEQPEPEPVATLFGSLPVYDVPTKQEPVAWMHNFIDEVVIAHRPADLDRHPDRWTPLYKDPTPCQTCESLARTVMMDQTYHDSVMAQHRKPPTQDLSAPLTVNGVPMYPQREWQGLTDEEVIKLGRLDKDSDYFGLWYDFARAIEAKLKEKNA